MDNIFDLLKEILEIDDKGELNKATFAKMVEELSVVKGTINRWILLKSVPKNYYFDLMKMKGGKIDYSSFTYREKDQFFTPEKTASYCIEVFRKKVKSLGLDEEHFSYIEPSAGGGAFLKLLPKERRLGLDIEPRLEEIAKQDFLKWSPDSTINNVVIGNPPFGLRGHTALRFINHSHDFADFVVFILPQFFESDGRGTPMKRVKGFNLIHSEKLDTSFRDPEGNSISVNTVFQIWSKNFKGNENSQSCKKYIRVYSLSDGGSPGTTRNKDLIGKCDVYIPSTCFGSKKMRTYQSFDELPNKKGYGVVFLREVEKVSEIFNNIDWAEASFKSTNSAFNLRTSKIEQELVKRGLVD
jgi:hypothetical protein